MWSHTHAHCFSVYKRSTTKEHGSKLCSHVNWFKIVQSCQLLKFLPYIINRSITRWTNTHHYIDSDDVYPVQAHRNTKCVGCTHCFFLKVFVYVGLFTASSSSSGSSGISQRLLNTCTHNVEEVNICISCCYRTPLIIQTDIRRHATRQTCLSLTFCFLLNGKLESN